ncbi:MAG: hypothetical protein HYS26_03520 [Candidatus Kaiserbacteria bacterium]|nr:MAG: hypothetical protein HYS26_03520 [Candidatus Kaiserbacteria bacterium]
MKTLLFAFLWPSQATWQLGAGMYRFDTLWIRNAVRICVVLDVLVLIAIGAMIETRAFGWWLVIAVIAHVVIGFVYHMTYLNSRLKEAEDNSRPGSEQIVTGPTTRIRG